MIFQMIGRLNPEMWDILKMWDAFGKVRQKNILRKSVLLKSKSFHRLFLFLYLLFSEINYVLPIQLQCKAIKLSPLALWFKRGMGPKIQGFISGLFSTVCIDRLCQRESTMVTLSPGLKHQCTMEKSQQI